MPERWCGQRPAGRQVSKSTRGNKALGGHVAFIMLFIKCLNLCLHPCRAGKVSSDRESITTYYVLLATQTPLSTTRLKLGRSEGWRGFPLRACLTDAEIPGVNRYICI